MSYYRPYARRRSSGYATRMPRARPQRRSSPRMATLLIKMPHGISNAEYLGSVGSPGYELKKGSLRAHISRGRRERRRDHRWLP